MQQAQTVSAPPTDDDTDQMMEVRFRSGESYDIAVRGHVVTVDQPADAGGQDEAPTPTELFVASLASCVAFYAGRYLTRHGYSRDGLRVAVAYDMATDRPARVTGIRVAVQVPAGLPAARRPALQAVVSHCTVHNSLMTPPAVTIELA
jgi:putative redox protein